MAAFLTVVAEHCRQAEHSLQLAGGIFNPLPCLHETPTFLYNPTGSNSRLSTSFSNTRKHLMAKQRWPNDPYCANTLSNVRNALPPETNPVPRRQFFQIARAKTFPVTTSKLDFRLLLFFGHIKYFLLKERRIIWLKDRIKLRTNVIVM